MLKEESITMQEILEAINASSTKIQEQFEAVYQRFDRVDARLDKVEQQLNYHTTWLNRIEENMVTKPQFNGLVGILRRNGVVSGFDGARITYRV